MTLVPAPNWRWVLKRGMRGTDVAALQINLPVAVDGIFGKLTARAVKGAQARLGILVDGVAGPTTQRAIAVDLSKPATRALSIPTGLLEGIMVNESGGALAAYSAHPNDDGYDLGAYQTSITVDRSQEVLHAAYDVMAAANRWGGKLKSARADFKGAVDSRYKEDMGGDGSVYPWQLATLAHNWPYAADNIATIGRIFDEKGRDDREEAWIVKVSGGALRTPREWALAYVERATALAQW